MRLDFLILEQTCSLKFRILQIVMVERYYKESTISIAVIPIPTQMENIVDLNYLKKETPYAALKSTLWPLFQYCSPVSVGLRLTKKAIT